MMWAEWCRPIVTLKLVLQSLFNQTPSQTWSLHTQIVSCRTELVDLNRAPCNHMVLGSVRKLQHIPSHCHALFGPGWMLGCWGVMCNNCFALLRSLCPMCGLCQVGQRRVEQAPDRASSQPDIARARNSVHFIVKTLLYRSGPLECLRQHAAKMKMRRLCICCTAICGQCRHLGRCQDTGAWHRGIGGLQPPPEESSAPHITYRGGGLEIGQLEQIITPDCRSVLFIETWKLIFICFIIF